MSIINEQDSEFNLVLTNNNEEKFEKIFTNSELNDKKNEYKKKYKKIKDENLNLSNTIMKLNAELNSKNHKHDTLLKLYDNKIDECKKYKTLYDDLLIKFNNIEKLNNEKSKALIKRYFTIEKLETQNHELSTKIDKLEKSNINLQKQIDELKNFYKLYENICNKSLIYNDLNKNLNTTKNINNITNTIDTNMTTSTKDTTNIKDIHIYENKIEQCYNKEKYIINDNIYRDEFKNIEIKDITNITSYTANENMIENTNENIINYDNIYETNYNQMYYDYFSDNITNVN